MTDEQAKTPMPDEVIALLVAIECGGLRRFAHGRWGGIDKKLSATSPNISNATVWHCATNGWVKVDSFVAGRFTRAYVTEDGCEVMAKGDVA